MSEHYDTDEGWPDTKAEVDAMSTEDLDDFASYCDVEPADPDNCLACYAYMVEQDREAEYVKEMKANPVHLTKTTSDRGFDYYPPIPSRYGGETSVSESSAAMGPHVWVRMTCPENLNNPSGPQIETVAHLTAEDAWKLADQLRATVREHYQGDATPEWANG